MAARYTMQDNDMDGGSDRDRNDADGLLGAPMYFEVDHGPSTTGCTRAFKLKSVLAVVLFVVWLVSVGLYCQSVEMLKHLFGYCDGLLAAMTVLGVAHGLVFLLLVAWAFSLWKKRPLIQYSFLSKRNNRGYTTTQMSDEEALEIGDPTRSGRSHGGVRRRGCRRCCAHVIVSMMVFILTIVIIMNMVLFALVFPQSEIGKLPETVDHAMLSQPVTVEYAKDGLVHIKAETMDDAHFGQGMATAQLRLWQMEFQRRVGTGTLAGIVGHSALDTDVMMRTFGFKDAARRSLRAMSPEARAALHSFANGVNAFMDTNPTLPLEFKVLGATFAKWQPEDSIIWFKVMSLDLSGNMDLELKRFKMVTELNRTFDQVQQLLPPFDMARFPTVLACDPDSGVECDTPGAYDLACTPTFEARYMDSIRNSSSRSKKRHVNTPDDVHSDTGAHGIAAARKWRAAAGGGRGGLGASNNWVVHGNYTQGGRPLLCNDPHLELLAPSIWILFHLEVNTPPARAGPGPLELIGTTFVGAPGIVLGRNQHIAWGVTNTGADVQDLFVLRKNSSGGYVLPDGVKVVKRQEHFAIAGRSGVSRTIWNVTGYGPIITKNGVQKSTHDLVLKWVSIDPTVEDTTFEAFVKLNSAKNYEGFRDALRSYVAPAQNFIFAANGTDGVGDIGYQIPGRIPIRRANYTGMFPTPLSETEAWLGFVNFTDLPHAKNPAKGFIASANNRAVPEGFKTHVTCDWDEGSDGYRAERITDMLLAGGVGNATHPGHPKVRHHTVDTMKAIQLDYTSYLFRDLNKTVYNICGESTANQQVCGILKAWDGVAAVGSPAATVFQKLYLELMMLPRTELGEDFKFWANPVYLVRAFEAAWATNASCTSSKDGRACRHFAVMALNRTGRSMDLSNPPAWGQDVHHAQFTHTILNASFAKCIGNRHVPHGGDDYTVNVGHYDYDDAAMRQHHGPSYRQIVDFSDLDGSLFLNPLGQYGLELSEHYDDLVERWSDGGYMPMVTANEDYRGSIYHTDTVKPA